MEYSLTNKKFVILILFISLNPCFNGILSDFEFIYFLTRQVVCLNPCSNGILSDSIYLCKRKNKTCLNPCSNGILSDISSFFVYY